MCTCAPVKCISDYMLVQGKGEKRLKKAAVREISNHVYNVYFHFKYNSVHSKFNKVISLSVVKEG